jgi:hypothetical protein
LYITYVFLYYYINIKTLKFYENWFFFNILKILKSYKHFENLWTFWNLMKILNCFWNFWNFEIFFSSAQELARIFSTVKKPDVLFLFLKKYWRYVSFFKDIDAMLLNLDPDIVRSGPRLHFTCSKQHGGNASSWADEKKISKFQKFQKQFKIFIRFQNVHKFSKCL